MIAEVWYDPDDNSIAVFPLENRETNLKLLGPKAFRRCWIVARNWIRVMTIHNERMGWEPYVPPGGWMEGDEK